MRFRINYAFQCNVLPTVRKLNLRALDQYENDLVVLGFHSEI